MRKYLRSSAAVLGLLILLLSMAGATVSAEQAYTVNGVNVRYNDFSSAPEGCFAYAHNFYYKIWGVGFKSDFYGSDNVLREYSKEELTLTPEHLKECVSKAVPGAVLRVCNAGNLYGNDFWGHSLLIVSIQEDGITTFEGGLSASPHCREHFYTWEEFCQTSWLGGRYGYIKYIKFPQTAVEEEVPSVRPGREEPDGPAQQETLETLETPEPVAVEAGDLNRSGDIDAGDYVALKRFVNGTLRLTDAQLAGGDLNGDGKVDEQDFRILKNRMDAERILPQLVFPAAADSLLNLLF